MSISFNKCKKCENNKWRLGLSLRSIVYTFKQMDKKIKSMKRLVKKKILQYSILIKQAGKYRSIDSLFTRFEGKQNSITLL